MKQYRVDITFIPDELQKLFGCCLFINYSDVAESANNIRMTICVTPPLTPGYFATIPKIPKLKTVSRPTKFLQFLQYKFYGDCVALRGH